MPIPRAVTTVLLLCAGMTALAGCAGSSFRAVSDFTACQDPGCANCKGSRQVICPACQGTPTGPCTFCNETGVRECGLCGGDGHVDKGSYNCPRCAGHGRFRCPRCEGGAVAECEKCKGTGKTHCGSLTTTYHCESCGAVYNEEPERCARCGKP